MRRPTGRSSRTCGASDDRNAEAAARGLRPAARAMTHLLNVLVVGLLLGGIYSLVSIGLNLIFGVIRIVNFAQGEFVMLGMYGTFAAVTMLHMDPYVSLVLTLPALFLLGVVVQRFLLQPLQNEPMMQIFATFGLLILLQNIVLAMTRGASLS